MTMLFGLFFLLALASIGRDGRVLPVQGVLAAGCVAVAARGDVAIAAALAALATNGAAWAGLRRLAPHEPGGRGLPQPALIGILGGMVLVLLLLLALAAPSDLPVLMAAGVVLLGLCGAAQPAPLVQFVGLLGAVNGLIVLAGVLGNGMLLLAALLVWAALGVLGVWLLPRLAWLRVDLPDEG
ncbi:hypothetical protein [Acidomonas methanolica]|uniref:hypothetical protein n=1 Tax=Acidomonas methanolica TaxID=437 RepID=UPI001044387D|nr:hypothetical protein [Acidomonas methanolica]MBU2654357.1 hypothetical protein [Acidomonas methanolica]TCS28445.1 hypothetical protein EDC31_10833 [Acidomonas methanolica]GEK99585.1 hypothetical protein AME01nite_20840 [Acidomonas methanolica NBRC 104435]